MAPLLYWRHCTSPLCTELVTQSNWTDLVLRFTKLAAIIMSGLHADNREQHSGPPSLAGTELYYQP